MNYILNRENEIYYECGWSSDNSILLSMDGEKDLENLDSLEMSSIFLNEANELSEEVFVKCNERIGRYPSAKDGAKCTEPGMPASCRMVEWSEPKRWIIPAPVGLPFRTSAGRFSHSAACTFSDC